MSQAGPGFLLGSHFFYLLFYLFGLLVVVAVVIAIVVLAVHASTRPAYPARTGPMQMGGAPPACETPLEILARRFASGEITAEEYQRARDLLGGGGKT